MDDRKLDSLVRPSELLLETPAHCMISLDHPPCSCQSVLAKCDATLRFHKQTRESDGRVDIGAH